MLSRREALGLLIKAMYWRLRYWWATPMRLGVGPPLRPEPFVNSAYTGSVATAIEGFRADVFPYRSHDAIMFAIEVEKKSAQAICNLVMDPRYEDHMFGHRGGLPDFFRDVVQDLQVNGISYTRIEWKPVSLGGRKSIVLPAFGSLRPEGVRLVHEGDKLVGYLITPLLAFPWTRAFHKMELSGHEEDEEPFRVEVDEVFALTAPGWRPGRPPLADFVTDHWRHRVAMNAKLGAFSFLNAGGLRVEAARYRSQRDLLREAELADMRMQDRAGASLLVLADGYPNLIQPVSEYFLAWQHQQVRMRAARWREAILCEFSLQILEPLLLRNAVEGKASLKAVGFKAEAEFEALFGRFLSERLSLEDFWRLCRDDEQNSPQE